MTKPNPVTTLANVSPHLLFQSAKANPFNKKPIIIKSSHFNQVQVTNRVKHIEVHDFQTIFVITENNQKTRVNPIELKLPPMNRQKLVQYLAGCSIKVIQNDMAEYRVEMNVKVLGGGGANSTPEVEQPDRINPTLLRYVLQGQAMQAKQLIITKQVNLDAPVDEEGNSLLSVAIAKFSKAKEEYKESFRTIIQDLVVMTVRVNRINSQFKTDFLMACSLVDEGLLRVFITHGGELGTEVDGQFAYILMCKNRKLTDEFLISIINKMNISDAMSQQLIELCYVFFPERRSAFFMAILEKIKNPDHYNKAFENLCSNSFCEAEYLASFLDQGKITDPTTLNNALYSSAFRKEKLLCDSLLNKGADPKNLPFTSLYTLSGKTSASLIIPPQVLLDTIDSIATRIIILINQERPVPISEAHKILLLDTFKTTLGHQSYIHCLINDNDPKVIDWRKDLANAIKNDTINFFENDNFDFKAISQFAHEAAVQWQLTLTKEYLAWTDAVKKEHTAQLRTLGKDGNSQQNTAPVDTDSIRSLKR